MLLNIAILFSVIFISVLFKYYFVKIDFFKENVMEGYKSELPESVLLDANISKNTAFDALSQQPILDTIKNYKNEVIPSLNSQIKEIQSRISSNNTELETLNKSSADYQNQYSTIVTDTNANKAKLQTLNQDEENTVKIQQDNSIIGIGIYSKAQTDHERKVELATKVPVAPTVQSITTKNDSVTFTFTASPDNGGHPVDFYTARMRTSTMDDYRYYRYPNISTNHAGTYTFTSNQLYGYDNNMNWNNIPLEKGKTYYFDIVPHNQVNYGTPSNIVTFIAGIPSAPTIQSITPGRNSVTFTLTASADDGGHPVDHYTTRIRTSNNEDYSYPYVNIVTGGTYTFSASQVYSKDNNNWNYTSLEEGKTYYFDIVPHNQIGYGTPSNVVSFTTLNKTFPSSPIIESITKGKINGKISATFVFTASTDDGGYPVTGYTTRIRVANGPLSGRYLYPQILNSHIPSLGTKGTFRFTEIYDVEKGTWNIPLESGTTYMLDIVASNAKGHGPPGNIVPFTIDKEYQGNENQCVRSYYFTGDNSDDARCPYYKPYCNGQQCYAPDDPTDHICAHDFNSNYSGYAICPSFKPKCVGHIGGKKWGTCT